MRLEGATLIPHLVISHRHTYLKSVASPSIGAPNWDPDSRDPDDWDPNDWDLNV